MGPAPHISPRVRAYGKARIDITRRAQDEDEWRRLWKGPSQPYPFKPGEAWKFNVLYTVDDFAAEIGFFIDVLGFPVQAFSPSRAHLTSPEVGFTFTILAAREEEASTPPEALRLQLNVDALVQTVRELERRGVTFDQQPAPLQAGSSWQVASFRTPHGVTIELLSEAPVEDTLSEPEEEAEQGSMVPTWEEDQLKTDESVAIDKISEEAEADEQATDILNEQQETSQSSEPQPSLWPRNSGGMGRLKTSKEMPGQTVKPGNGNLELTYDSLDDEEVEGDAIDAEEDYP